MAVTDLFFGLFIGVMLTAAAYLFVIWVILRDIGHLFLIGVLLGLASHMASGHPVFSANNTHNMPWLLFIGRYASLLCVYYVSILFAAYFLDINASLRWVRLSIFFSSAFIFAALLYIALMPSAAYLVVPLVGTIILGIVMIFGVVAFSQRVGGSFVHILAFFSVLCGCIAHSLLDVGFLTTVVQANSLTHVAFGLAALLFAIVIAGQFAKRQEDKERALALSNERFALAARGSSEGLFDWHWLTGEVWFSDQLQRLVGKMLDQGERGLYKWMRLIHRDDRLSVISGLRKFNKARNATTFNVEYRVLDHNKADRWLHTKAVATRNMHTGNIERLVGATGDITARKRSEFALRASEARFRSITEAHPVPIVIARLADWRVLYASAGTESMLGMQPHIMMNQTLDRLVLRAADCKNLADDMENNRAVNLREIILIRSGGETITTALSARRILYNGDVAMVAGLYDLTERKAAEEQIARQQEALQQSEKMAALGGLLAGVAHELNNPLSVVVGQATLLQEGSSEEGVRKRATTIFTAADRCARIVKSFLALARRKPPEYLPVDINSTITNALELLGYEIRQGNISLSLDLDNDLPRIVGDADQITQVVANLALNATQAMREWQGQRNLIITTRSKGQDFIEVRFIDSGPGIPFNIRKRVFEPFFTTRTAGGGTGVGLSLCLNIISGHGGTINIEDTQGGGATFVITLPVSHTKHEVSREDNKLPAGDNIIPTKPLSILIVDDEFELAQTLADLLEQDGHKTDLAINGAIALDKLSKSKADFDVIISDLRMPVLDGPGLYDAFKGDLEKWRNRIIYVTGDTLSPNVQSFLSSHSVPLVEKPWRIEDIRKVLAEVQKEW